jgi:hypothetical protein
MRLGVRGRGIGKSLLPLDLYTTHASWQERKERRAGPSCLLPWHLNFFLLF